MHLCAFVYVHTSYVLTADVAFTFTLTRQLASAINFADCTVVYTGNKKNSHAAFLLIATNYIFNLPHSFSATQATQCSCHLFSCYFILFCTLDLK